MPTLLACALALVPQAEPAAPPSQGRPTPDEGWVPYNRVELIVNEECLTNAEIVAAVRRSKKPFSGEQELLRQFRAQADEQVREILMIQGGRDLGFDDKLIQRLVDDRFAELKESAGSASLWSRQLAEENVDTIAWRTDKRAEVYGTVWRSAVTGRSQGPGGRPYVDSYVRPGRLRFESEHNAGKLDQPARVVLQQLRVEPSRAGGDEQARLLAEELRRRIAAGEDFGELAELYEAAAPGSGARLPPIAEADLASFPEVLAFVRGAQPGELSEVLPRRVEGGALGYELFRLVERHEARAAKLTDPELQRDMARALRNQLDNYHINSGLQRLLEAAYVWTPEVSRPEPAANGQPSGR
jgi:parvulin-like peptidyl-prolyl isomerase